MNPRLALLRPYPFERLRATLADARPPAHLPHINLGIGEPQHPTPALIKEALVANLDGLSKYPATLGVKELRVALAEWIARRHGAVADPEREVLPILGSREAIFAIAQVILDPAEKDALVISPNPFYQIYEGAAYLGGASPYFVNLLAGNGFRPDWDSVPAEVWKRTRIVYTCSPSNPTGQVMSRDEWQALFALSDRHGFVIVSDECYSEIYFDEGSPPMGALRAATQLGREGFPRLIVMGSLSKRSSAPGLRSGFAAGDRELLAKFVLYRTYHGTQMSNSVQMASVAAWRDEAHVIESRRLYRGKFATFHDKVNPVLPLAMPEAAFYFWAHVGGDDVAFARDLFTAAHVTVLPGSYIGREAHGVNPGHGYVRMALVSTLADATEAASRIAAFTGSASRLDPATTRVTYQGTP